MSRTRSRRYRGHIWFPDHQTPAIRNWIYRIIAHMMDEDKPVEFRFR